MNPLEAYKYYLNSVSQFHQVDHHELVKVIDDYWIRDFRGGIEIGLVLCNGHVVKRFNRDGSYRSGYTVEREKI